MKKIISAIAALSALCTLSACDRADPEVTSRRALEGLGMTHIETRHDFWGFACGDSDDWSRKFTAVGPTGVYVSGNVCGQYWGKGATVRFA